MQHTAPKGAVLLFNVLVMGVVAVAAAAVLARGSLEGFFGSTDTLAAWNTRADVFGCIDEAIIQLKKDNNFSTVTLSTGTATCTISITTPGAGLRSVVASLTEGDVTRQATASITLSPFAVTQITEP